MSTEKKDGTKRIYRVTAADGVKRLVRAVSPAAAVGHVYKPDVGVASQNDLAELLGAGVKVEDA